MKIAYGLWVNENATTAYASLEAFARERGAPDVVDVFRRTAEAVEVARQAIAVGAKAIWFQIGVANDEAVRLADAAGLYVVAERCIKVELKALRREAPAPAAPHAPHRAE